ncbi:MAG: two-component system response regulator [Spirochaetes bacterium]|jgi:putative two-component system response regulator|nr:two-component system response regulator [Spirochaetota bacterium]
MNVDISKSTILIVDDIKSNIDLLMSLLKNEYIFSYATSGMGAIESLKSRPADLILLDIMMPEMDGYKICKMLKSDENTIDIPVIFITALSESEDKTLGFRLGAVDYITKPFDIEEVKARIETHLNLKKAREELQNQRAILEMKVRERTKELYDTRLEIVYRLGRAAEYRDNDTGMHIKRMSMYCVRLGRAIGLSDEECDLILHASPMHDVGKIGIPDSILLKPGPLTKVEWERMKAHTTIGGEILSGHDSPQLKMAESIALTHHEKWDGTGYPKGLKGENIPLEGRISCICDVFDALVSVRPYKKSWPVNDAVEEIKKGGGTQFEPMLVDKFVNIIDEFVDIKNKFPDPVNHQ